MTDEELSIERLAQRIRELEGRLAARDQTIENLRQDVHHLQRVADLAHDGEYWRGPDGTLHYVSPSCERMTGFSTDEFISRPDLLLDIVHPGDRAACPPSHLAARTGRRFRFSHMPRRRQVCWINHVCQPMYDARGQLPGASAKRMDNPGLDLMRTALAVPVRTGSKTIGVIVPPGEPLRRWNSALTPSNRAAPSWSCSGTSPIA